MVKNLLSQISAITCGWKNGSVWFLWNKWKQFPVNEIKKLSQLVTSQKNIASKPQKVQKNTKTEKSKKTTVRKPREIDLYSPEYLAKKHGIKLMKMKLKKLHLMKKKFLLDFIIHYYYFFSINYFSFKSFIFFPRFCSSKISFYRILYRLLF